MTADLEDWLRLTLSPGIGGSTQRQLLQAFGLPSAIFSAGLGAVAAIIGPAAAQKLFAETDSAPLTAALDWATQDGHSIITLADANYPAALLQSADPPTLLYAKGNLAQLQRPALAIVGSRNATQQGEIDAEAFAATLSAAGFAIVSGLALGIDAAAHRGGLQHPQGGTIAVIGTGIDRIYPARNEALARAIAQQGLILSEFPLGTPALAANFPRRNRIIAGLARGCLVVEAAARSGSLITARLAAESGREVFAIPGSIHSPLSHGCHQLIHQGAKLVESAQDILEEFGWQQAALLHPAATNGANAEEDKILAALGHAPCDLESLATRCGLTPEALLAMLLAMELEGRIAALPGGRYQRLEKS